MINLKKVHPTVRLRIYKERLETMPEEYKPKGLDKGNKACYSDNKINNMNKYTYKLYKNREYFKTSWVVIDPKDPYGYKSFLEYITYYIKWLNMNRKGTFTYDNEKCIN